MTIKTKSYYCALIWALIPFLDVISYFINPESFHLSISILKVITYALMAFAFFVYWKKRELLFESTEEGIWIIGSKEGMYDPDFVKYEEILSCDYDKKQIHLKLKDGRFVNFRLQKRNIEKAYNEIIKRLGQEHLK